RQHRDPTPDRLWRPRRPRPKARPREPSRTRRSLSPAPPRLPTTAIPMTRTGTMASSAEHDSGESSLIEHLVELRTRLLRAMIGLGIALVALLPFANRLYGWFAQPLLDKLPQGAHLIAVEVASPFFAPLKLALFAAVLV